jgi:hypothetical protein
MEKSLQQAQVFQNNHYSAEGNTEGTGSGYSLGDYDADIFGLLKVFPAAVNVTLFRPYLWEIRNPVMILAALESFVILVFTLNLFFFRVRFFEAIRILFNSPFVLMCFCFSILFAFSVGFSSYNFGALVRYKIPCMPFYIAFLFMLEYEIKEKLRGGKETVRNLKPSDKIQ